MIWRSAIARSNDLAECVESCAAEVRGAEPADLVMVFVSSLFRHRFDEVPGLLARHLPSRRVLGCSGGGTIGAGRELEHTPAVALSAATMPGVDLATFHLEADDLPDLDGPPDAWHRALGVPPEPIPHFVLLSDPFSFDVESLASGLDYAYPRSTKVGGLASDSPAPGGNALFVDGDLHESGLAGLALSGNVQVDTVVAQGCRPIGEPMVITRCRHNLLLELDGRAPMQVLQDMLPRLEERDRRLIRHSLFLGVVMDPTNAEPGPGDFLIRNLMGVDPEGGALAVGAELRHGQTVQFHLRDARTSAEDLERMLARYADRTAGARPEGALLFSCLGRGQYLYGEADHDSRALRSRLGEVPVTGFFCNGEIGPVGGSTYVHGYTSCIGLFRTP